MSYKTDIEWTDAAWNPLAGCSIVSPACTNCYAMAQAARIVRCAAGLGRATHYADTVTTVKGTPVWTGEIRAAPDHVLTQPLRWWRPRRIFVNSMSDLFHEAVPDAWIDRIFAVMAHAPQHTFQVLTKRPERMRAYLTDSKAEERIAGELLAHASKWGVTGTTLLAALGIRQREEEPERVPLPLRNVWLGVTAEDQPRADDRIPIVLDTPAAKRFVSIEPMLGAVDLTELTIKKRVGEHCFSALECDVDAADDEWGGAILDWVICGGESGPDARPMHPDWVRSLRDQCAAAGVPFFMKQMSGARKIDRDAIPSDLFIREFPNA